MSSRAGGLSRRHKLKGPYKWPSKQDAYARKGTRRLTEAALQQQRSLPGGDVGRRLPCLRAPSPPSLGHGRWWSWLATTAPPSPITPRLPKRFAQVAIALDLCDSITYRYYLNIIVAQLLQLQ
jgi:hypothetical protein